MGHLLDNDDDASNDDDDDDDEERVPSVGPTDVVDGNPPLAAAFPLASMSGLGSGISLPVRDVVFAGRGNFQPRDRGSLVLVGKG